MLFDCTHTKHTRNSTNDDCDHALSMSTVFTRCELQHITRSFYIKSAHAKL